MKDKVLLFHVEDEDVQLKIEMALFLSQISLRRVEKDEYLQTIGALAGVEGMELTGQTYEGEELPEPMLVLCMDSNRVDQVLAAFRSMGVPRIGCKAMLTPTNSNWTPLALYRELKREQEEFRLLEQKKKETAKSVQR